jgi:hypothetical protein
MQCVDSLFVHYVAGNDCQFWPTRFNALDCLHYACGISVGCIDDNGIHIGVNQRFDARFQICANTDRSSNP